jgi:D-sedoheptulose 7-phosphate isomerase
MVMKTNESSACSADGQLEAYFQTLGRIGSEIVATDAEGVSLTLGTALAKAVQRVERAKAQQRCIMFVGNGGSAGITSHMATDWLKNGGFKTLCFNDGAQLTCLANDLGYDQVFAVPVERHGVAEDVLFAISSSGNSPSILNSVSAARERGMTTITLSGFKPDNKLRAMGDLNFYVPDPNYGFVEISHLAICHAILDTSMGWRAKTQDDAAFSVVNA